MRFEMPSLASSWSRSVSTNQTSRGALTFGMMMTSRFSPARWTVWTMSSRTQRVCTALIRTARVLRAQSRVLSASIVISRADSFWAGATASSRSRKTRSASLPAAFWIIFSLEPGVASSERRRRTVIRSPPGLPVTCRSRRESHRCALRESGRGGRCAKACARA